MALHSHLRGAPRVSLRAVAPGDDALLRAVYASTRDAELAMVDWDDAAKQAFIDHQFHAQNVHYRTNWAGGQYDLVLLDGEPVGRLYVHRSIDEIMLLDIAILAAHRNRGVGTQLVGQLMAEAAAAGVPLRLHVEMFNDGARCLYDRLGFLPVEQRGPYTLMEWTAGHDPAAQGGRRNT